uniref:Uncharacterized protein n=1 Tax=Solanum tuberosum TaxID=4113 RepID=M1DG77_SOLTU
MQPLQQDQEKLFTMDFTDGKVQGKMQGNQEQLANDEAHSGTSKDKQHGNGEKTKWKVKDTINSNANTMQQSKDNGRIQPDNTNKERKGKLVNFAPNVADHSDTSRNKLYIGQNELGKGRVVVQTDRNEVTGQAGELSHMSLDIDPKILPPPLKIIQKTGMNSKTPVIEIEESGDQIPIPPSPVNVDVENFGVENEVPSPATPLFVAAEVFGGRMVVKEKNINLQEGVPKGREMSHVLHENQMADPRNDLPATATTTSVAQ